MSFREKIQRLIENYENQSLSIASKLKYDVLAVYTDDALSRERERKQKLLNLFEALPLEFNLKLGEVYKIGTKAEWREWLKKLKVLLKEWNIVEFKRNVGK